MKLSVSLFAAAVMLVPAQAQSQETEGWHDRLVGYNRDGTAHYARVYCRRDGRCYRPRRQEYAHHRGTRVYSYVRREGGEEGGTCRDIRRAVGDQHLTVDGAKKAANDAWAGTVRFHLGVLLLWTGRIEAAQRQFRLAARSQPESPLAREAARYLETIRRARS